MNTVWTLLLITRAFGAMVPAGEFTSRQACEDALATASFSIDAGASWHDATYFAAGGLNLGGICIGRTK